MGRPTVTRGVQHAAALLLETSLVQCQNLHSCHALMASFARDDIYSPTTLISFPNHLFLQHFKPREGMKALQSQIKMLFKSLFSFPANLSSNPGSPIEITMTVISHLTTVLKLVNH